MKANARVALFFGGLGLGALAALRYRRWVSACKQSLESGSSLLETSQGPVEYAVLGSTGPAMLCMHGRPGGYDQGIELGEASARRGVRLVTPSRPGYLRTPLEVGRSPEEQADAFAALLDGLNISRVAVVGLSGGGPAALQFVLRHPDRCLAFVAISAVSLAMEPAADLVSRLLASRLFTSNFAGWLLGAAARRWPALLVQALVPSAEARAAVLSDPRKLSILAGLAQAGFQLPAERRAGNRNDVEQFAALPAYPVEDIQVPTLVIHGTADALVPYAHAQFITENVPGAELHAIKGGTHAIYATHADEVRQRLFDFVTAQGELEGRMTGDDGS
jgi:pimeloyl-ACP methyl ester carboxylesterase